MVARSIFFSKCVMLLEFASSSSSSSSAVLLSEFIRRR